MRIIGIDQSLTSTGVTDIMYDENYTVKDFKYYFTTSASTKKSKNDVYPVYINKEFKSTDKALVITEKVFEKIDERKSDETYIAFEGGSYASSGTLFQLGQISGMLMSRAGERNFHIQQYEPSRIKLFATGKGKGDKLPIFKAFMKQDNEFLKKLVDYFPKGKHTTSGFMDIIDSYFISQLLLLEVQMRKGFKRFDDLNENEIRIMNFVSKANPINLLGRNFIGEL